MAGGPGVVVGGQVAPGHGELDRLGGAGLQGRGAGEGDELAGGLAQGAVGLGDVELDDGGPDPPPGVAGAGPHAHALVAGDRGPAGDLVGGVAQAESEGVEDGVGGEGLEVAVADEDVLDVVVGLRVAEVAGGGVVLVAAGDRVGQAAAGLVGAGQDAGDGAPALHAAAPGQQEGVHAQLLGPGQVDDIAGHDHGDGALEGPGGGLQEGALVVGEVVGARFEGGLAVLPGGPPDDDDGGGRAGRGGGDGVAQPLVQRHLGEAQGPAAPLGAGVDGVGLAPGLGQGGEGGVDGDALLPQGVEEVGDVRGVDVAAGAVADGDPVLLDPAQHGDGRGGVQGEGVVLVAQQDGAAHRQEAGGVGEVGVEAGGVGGLARGRRGKRLGEELIGHVARVAMKP